MNIDAIAKRAAGATELFVKRHGPEILTGIGILGFGATTYLVGKAVVKAQPSLEDFKKGRQEIANKQVGAKYTEKDRAREMGKYVIIESSKIVKIFVPAGSVGVAAVFCVVASHGMMRSKQASLLAAYTALDAGFKAYRARVREELGEEKELELYRRPAMRALDQTEDGEPGEEVDYAADLPTVYARYFDSTCPDWQKTPEWNLMFLRAQQQYLNDRLTAYGFVFLNEAYEALGMERSQAGQIVGWLRNGNGDGYIDFGMYDEEDERARAFINGQEAAILVDFNVDGPITI